MGIPINQYKKIEEKLRIYAKPFIDISLLQKIIDKFAPNYKIFQLSSRGLISPIKQGELYLNKTYRQYISRYAILWKYMTWKTYMIGGIYLYNQYGFSTQLANRITVYNTIYDGKREIAWAKFIFKKMRPSFFRGKQKKQSQGIYYYVMSPERALIQLLKEKNGKPEFADDIHYQISKWKVDIKQINKMCTQYCSENTKNLLGDFLRTWSKE